MAINGFRDFAYFEWVRDLSQGKIISILEDPVGSARRIHDVAYAALDYSQRVQDFTPACQLLAVVEKLNTEYQSKGHEQSFTEIIKILKAAIPGRPNESKAAFCKMVLSLDLNDKQLRSKIVELLSILNSLEKESCITPLEKQQLSDALNSLVDPSQFKACEIECRAQEFVCSKSLVFNTALEEARFLFAANEQEARSAMLKSLKASVGLPLDQCAKKVNADYRGIKNSLIKGRLDAIISKIQSGDHCFNKTFAANFPFLMRSIRDFRSQIARPLFQGRWELFQQKLDPTGSGRFCTLLSNYPVFDPVNFIPEMVLKAEANYLKPLTLDSLCSPKFQETITKRNEIAKAHLEELFNRAYEKHFMKEHIWLAANMDAIQKPYSQAADHDVNQAKGTCLQNSLDRHAVLLLDPTPDGSRIQMQSTQAGRVSHTLVTYKFNQAKMGLIPAAEFNKFQLESCSRLGLRCLSDSQILEGPEAVVKALDAAHFSNRDVLQILSLTGPDGGHAINIQINHGLRILRFIDDNLGVCGWSTYDSFREQFLDCMKSFYPTFNRFTLLSFAKK